MKIRFVTSYSTAREHFANGKTYELNDDEAGDFIQKKLAVSDEAQPVELEKPSKRKANK